MQSKVSFTNNTFHHLVDVVYSDSFDRDDKKEVRRRTEETKDDNRSFYIYYMTVWDSCNTECSCPSLYGT